jgi:hypothetical protein
VYLLVVRVPGISLGQMGIVCQIWDKAYTSH